MRRAPLIAALLLAALVAAIPGGSRLGASGASSSPTAARLGIRPLDQPGPYLRLELQAGQRATARVALRNPGADVVRSTTYAADAYTLVNGGFGARLAAEPIGGTTRWLAYPTVTIDLAPRSEMARSVTVTVPSDAAAGEYIAALVVQPLDPGPVGGSPEVRQVAREAIAVAISVPGPARPELRISGIEHQYAPDGSVLRIGVQNPGNRHLRPSGSFTIADAGGRRIDERHVSMDTVYAGTSTVLEVHTARLPAGAYVGALSLADGATSANARLPFTVGPIRTPTPTASGSSPWLLGWWLLTIVPAICVTAWLLHAGWRGRRRARVPLRGR